MMSRAASWLLLAAVVAMVAVQGTAAQRAADLLSNLPPAGDLAVSYYFPEHNEKSLPAGDIIPVVVSGRNTGSKPMNLSAIVGSINSPDRFDVHIQNLTIARYFVPVAPGAEASLEYRFRADPILGATPPREFALALHLFYEVEGAYYSSTFFNATADITEVPRVVDFDLLWLLGTLAALAALGGYFAYGALAERLGLPKLNARRRAAKKADAGAGAAAIDGDEWVKGTHYELQKRRRAAAAKRA